jgi:hypothetical protein
MILGAGLFINSAQASPRAGTFDDPSQTVPKHSKQTVERRTFQVEIAPPLSVAARRRLHDTAP